MRFLARTVGVLLVALAFAAPAGAATSSPTSGSGLYVAGAGFGHGIGLSQYGAAGFAQHGYTYQAILQHYYAQTTLGSVNPHRTVTVLLRQSGAVAFSGARTIRGARRKLNPKTRYSVLISRGLLRIMTNGRTIGYFKPPLQVSPPAGSTLTLIGQGAYRGSFVIQPSTNRPGAMVINSVGLDNYVRGVVGAEMPSSWPEPALEAQAVAARTYAITAGAINSSFDVYDDTRSQMYEGVSAETASTNAAVAATTGRVVEYDGQPVITYFFASSGGQTESIQNVWAGVQPEAWLISQPDPYDDVYNNPYYRWTQSYTLGSASNKLKGLFKGTLEGINVLQTGVSPRVVQAQVVGTTSSSTVSGTTLESRLGTDSTWMAFTTVSSQGVVTVGTSGSSVVGGTTAPTTDTTTTTTPTTTSTDGADTTTTTPTGATALVTTRSPEPSPYAILHARKVKKLQVKGRIFPVHAGVVVTAERRVGKRWVRAGHSKVKRDGQYVITVKRAGRYRVLYRKIDGPTITVR